MNTLVPLENEESLDQESLLIASLILSDVRQLISGVQATVAILLRYVTMGASIANCLMDWIAPTPAGEC